MLRYVSYVAYVIRYSGGAGGQLPMGAAMPQLTAKTEPAAEHSGCEPWVDYSNH